MRARGVTKALPFPYAYYSVLAPEIHQAGAVYTRRATQDGQDVESVRTEQPTATLSFTFCGEDRDGPDGPIYGEDEALALAEKAAGWFRHVGYHLLQRANIVVLEVQNFASRSQFMVTQQARRWGFDVTVRYASTDARNDSAIDYTTLIQRRD